MADTPGDHVYRPDRSGWPEGPWHGEPDHGDWDDAATGLACSLRRNFAGIWCGYVAVPRGHPLHGRRRIAGSRGLVNYAGPNRLGLPGGGPWFFGFDCGGLSPACSHLTRAALRASPGLAHMDGAFDHERYRDIAEARAECSALAASVAGAAAGTGGRP